MDEPKFSLIPLQRFEDERGTLAVLEGAQIPFEMKRAFCIKGVPTGKTRAGHAHRVCHQLIVCLQGAVTASVDDARFKRDFRLEREDEGLYVPPMTWLELRDFEPMTWLMVVASCAYVPEERISERASFYREVSARVGIDANKRAADGLILSRGLNL